MAREVEVMFTVTKKMNIIRDDSEVTSDDIIAWADGFEKVIAKFIPTAVTVERTTKDWMIRAQM